MLNIFKKIYKSIFPDNIRFNNSNYAQNIIKIQQYYNSCNNIDDIRYGDKIIQRFFNRYRFTKSECKFINNQIKEYKLKRLRELININHERIFK